VSACGEKAIDYERRSAILSYLLAVLAGLLLSGVLIIDFRKVDVSPPRRVLSNVLNILVMTGVCIAAVYNNGLTYRFIIYAMLGVNLLYISNSDIREQTVSYETICISVICALAVLAFNKDNAWWNYILTGVGFTLVFMLISRVTRSAVGIGDALITGSIGLYLGFFHTLVVVILALLLGGVLSLILFILKKVTRQTPLPFAPFLAAGFLVSILI